MIEVREPSVPGFELLCWADDVLGEGPLWDPRSNTLLWVDILRGRVHRWSAHGGLEEVARLDALIGAIALADEADLLLATSKGLWRRCGRSAEMRLLANPLEGRPLRFNDGRVDALARFWVGTMAIDPEHYGKPWGALYRYDPDGSLHCMEQGLTISNDWTGRPTAGSFISPTRCVGSSTPMSSIWSSQLLVEGVTKTKLSTRGNRNVRKAEYGKGPAGLQVH